jgi:uncharacterized protein YjbJ (UPF0337 family)
MELRGYDNAELGPGLCARALWAGACPSNTEENIMNWDQIEGKFTQMKGGIKKQWGKLTDDDLEYMAGSKDQFVGRLQERYGLAKEAAQTQADAWLKAQGKGKITKTTTTTTTTHQSGGGAS